MRQTLICDNDRTMHDSLALITRHPRLPGVELHHGPRSGESYLIAVGVRLDGNQLIDVGTWLIEHGQTADQRRR
jgi:hypothetical protein